MTERAAPLNIAGKLAGIFIESKITAMIMLAVTLAGMMALFVTPREYNPQIVVPAANIIVAKPGASAEEIQNLVVKPLEAIMNAQSGVDHTFGYAAPDFGLVTVQFKVGEDQERSLVKLYNQLMQNLDRMPQGAMQPVIKPINVDDVPIMTLTLSSTTVDDHQIRQVATRVLENLRNVPGVSFTQVTGGSPRAVNVWISPARLAAAGIALDQVDKMLQGQNVSVPVGKLVDNNRVSPLQLQGFLGNAQEVGDIVIGAPNGRPVFLKDVATIEEGPQEVDESTRFAFGPAAGKDAARGEAPAVTLAIAKKAGTNAVVVANAVLTKLDQLKRQAIPADITVAVTRDDGARANDAVNTLVEHLGIAIGSVVVILVFFLGWREAGIVTLTVPLILFVVLTIGLFAGQTINRITLFALILSLGLLVDAAIVVVENIHRHLHHGIGDRDFKTVVIQATNEIGNPTNIATIAVILAFIPMAFVTGMMGPFMLPIPFNVPVAMIASLLFAYIVVPWAANLWLRKKAALSELARKESLEESGARKTDPLHRAYVKVITPFIEHGGRRNLMFLAVLGLLGVAMLMPAWQFIRPSGINGPLSALGVELKMLPNDNTNTFLVEIATPAGTTLEETDRAARAVGEVLANNRFVTNYQTFLGMTAPIDFAALVRGDLIKRGDNLAQIRVNLVDKHQRSTSSHTIVQDLNDSLKPLRQAFPQARVKLYETPPGPPVQAQVLAELYGPDYEKLRSAAPEVRRAFDSVYGMINTDDSVTATLQSFAVRVDREKAALSGVVTGQVGKLLRDYVSGLTIGSVHVDSARDPVNIVVRLPRAERQSPESLMAIRVTNMMGGQVPLGAIAKIEQVPYGKPIYDRDQHPMVMVGGEMITSSPVYAVLALDKMLDGQLLANGVRFKTGNLGFTQATADNVADTHLLWGGEMRLTLDVFRDLGSAFIIALVFIYLLLVGYYRSFVMPMIVMGAIPLTLVGVFPGHWATGQAFTATSMIGVIALAGIVVRNSLLLIDFIVDYRNQGYGLKEAVIEAGAVRLRPILLTALAIVLGSAIMITDPVFGGLAVSLIFGTFASTVLTLIVIPLLYYIWQKRSTAQA